MLLASVAAMLQRMHEVAAAEDLARTEAAEVERAGPKIVELGGGEDDDMPEASSDGGDDECPTQVALAAHTKKTGNQVLSSDDALGVYRAVVSSATARRKDKLMGARGGI